MLACGGGGGPDPAVALLGAAVIGQWSYSVLRSTARALGDATEDPALTQRIRDLIEADGDAKVAEPARLASRREGVVRGAVGRG